MICALGVGFADTASARMTKAKKQAMQRKLIRELKKNPKLIKNRRWLRAAGHVDAYLPLTIRLNPIVKNPVSGNQAERVSDDNAKLDLSETFGPEVGLKDTRLVGDVKVMAHFGNPAEGDALGDLRITVSSADLYASSVGVLTNTNVGAECGGLGAPGSPQASLQHATSLAGGYVDSAGNPATDSQLAPSVDGFNTVFRTAPIHLSSVNIPGSPNIGKANLFQTSNNVRLALHVGAQVNSIFRSAEDGSAMVDPHWLPTALFLCDETYAGATDSSGLSNDPTAGDIGTVGHANVIPVDVVGNLEISPAITTDGKLRLAKVDVHSQDYEHSTIDACLQPHGLVSNAKSLSDSLTATGLPAPTGYLLVDQSTPSRACDAAYPGAATDWPLSHAGVQELTGTGPTGVSSKFVQLEPDVKVTALTAEALVGQ
jgi:hypothetical protein